MRAAHSITPLHRFTLVALLLLATAAPRTLSAQLLRGTVRDSATQSPIAGAVFILLDSSGASIGRNISNDRGEYSIVLHSSMRRVQVLRIGFRPRTLRIPSALEGVATLDVSMVAIPRLLETVSIVDQPNCPKRPDRVEAFALWEQARAALLAVVVAREANPAHVVRLHGLRRSDANERVTRYTVLIDSAKTARPFIAPRSASDFVERGFSYDSAGITWNSGPDADTMLDDAFVHGYCFQVAASDTSRPKQVGLAFEPAQRQRGRVDIAGTVWIDSASLSLTDIVFKYVGASQIAQRANAGGRISFRTMENGTAIIDRWLLRTAGFARSPSGRMTVRDIVNAPIEIQETLGEVATAEWADGRAWHASLGTVRGQLADHPRPGVQIRLLDTDYRAVTDSAGRFEISNLLPGSYRIGVIDPTFAEIDLMLMTYNRVDAVRDSVTTVSVVTPTAEDYIAGVCTTRDKSPIDALLIARIELPNGNPAADANIEARVFAGNSMQRIAQGKTDRNGLFQLCNPPRDMQITLRIDRDGMQPAYLTTTVRDRITPVKLRLQEKER